MASYALVHWKEENMFAVLSTRKIHLDESNDSRVDDLIGKAVQIFWDRKLTVAVVLALGSKAEMMNEEAMYLKEANEKSFDQNDLLELDLPLNSAEDTERPAEPRRSNKRSHISKSNVYGDDFVDPNDVVVTVKKSKRRSKLLTEVQSNRTESDNDVISQMVNEMDRSNAPDNETSNGSDNTLENDKDRQIAELKELLQKRTAEASRYKGLLKKSSKFSGECANQQETHLVDLGNGVEVSSYFLGIAKAMYEKKPSLFMKRLVYDSGVFELEYVAGCSLTGYKTSKGPNVPRPALNPVKMAAMKQYVMDQCNLKVGTKALLEFELSLKNICTDARKQLKNRVTARRNMEDT